MLRSADRGQVPYRSRCSGLTSQLGVNWMLQVEPAVAAMARTRSVRGKLCRPGSGAISADRQEFCRLEDL